MWTDLQVVDFFTSATPGFFGYDRDAQGVELEIEFRNAYDYDGVNRFVRREFNWNVELDGSLRGVAYEYITPPRKTAELLKNFEEFEKCVIGICDVEKFEDVLYKSHRTSTHVHQNFTEDSVEEQLKFVSLYYLFEQVFYELAEQDRKGNTYCVSSNVIPFRISDNIDAKRPYTTSITDKEANKYASLNFSRLKDLGTLETRLMHGYTGHKRTGNWLLVLEELKKSARERFKSLGDIDKKYLDIPCRDFLEYVFPKMHRDIAGMLRLKDVSLKERLAEGYRCSFAILRHADLVQEGVKQYPEALERIKKAEEEQQASYKALYVEAAHVAPIRWYDNGAVRAGAADVNPVAVGARGVPPADWFVVDDFGER